MGIVALLTWLLVLLLALGLLVLTLVSIMELSRWRERQHIQHETLAANRHMYRITHRAIEAMIEEVLWHQLRQ
jgi:hypothetical protein